MKNIIQRTFSGLKWSYISVIFVGLFQLIYTSIMARLLDPSAFGLVAMANIILRFGTYFSRMGIGSALIQKQDLSTEDVRAGFSISILTSSTVALIIILISAPLSQFFFGSDSIVPIVRVLAISLIITGTNITSVSLLRREFRFRELAISEILSFLGGAIFVGVPLAISSFGVWSLVISSLTQGVILTISTYYFSKHLIKPLLTLHAVKPLISFGGRVSIISFLEFLNYNIDTMIIGRWFGSELLGIYNRAFYVISLPAERITVSVTKVLFSSFSEIQNEKEKLEEAQIVAILLLGLILFPMLFGMSAASKEIIIVILGDQWEQTIPILRILAIGVPFNILNSINGILFEAIGLLNTKILLVIIRLVLLMLLFSLFFPFGLQGFSFSFLFASVIYYFLYIILLSKKMNIKIIKQLKISGKLISIGIFSYTVISVISMILTKFSVHSVIILLIEIAFGGIFLIFIFFVIPPREIIEFIVKRFSNFEISKNNSIINRVYNYYYRLFIKGLK